jgi:adenylate kinase
MRQVSRSQNADNMLACVFGVSGVGKSELISRFVEGHRDWRRLGASELLEGLNEENREALRTSPREKIVANQYRAADLILEKRAQNPSFNFILDAHSIIDNDRELVPVPTSAVSAMEPSMLVFVFDDPAKILSRRESDASRIRAFRTISEIALEQGAALESAKRFSSELALDLSCIRSGDLESLEAALSGK